MDSVDDILNKLRAVDEWVKKVGVDARQTTKQLEDLVKAGSLTDPTRATSATSAVRGVTTGPSVATQRGQTVIPLGGFTGGMGGAAPTALQLMSGLPPNYLNNYYDAINSELQRKLVSYLTGKATGGSPSKARMTEVVNKLLGGEALPDRVRVGGGARLSLTSLLEEINKIIDQTIEESLRIRRQQYEQWASTTQANIGAQSFATGQPDIVTERPDAPQVATKKTQAQQIMQKYNEDFTNFNQALISAAKNARISFDSIKEIKPGTPIDLKDGFRQLNLTLTDAENKLGSVTLYLNKHNEALTKEQYLLQKYSPENLQAQMGGFRSQQLLKQAEKYGFRPENITKLFTQQPSGVTIGKFERIDEQTGAVNTLEVAVDKVGNTINRTNKRLLGFTDSIIKNTQEVLKWSIGVGLVYGTMYKLQALIKTAIDNETKLADITVVLGDVHRDLNDVFDEAAKVANETGESINDVLETYTMAYRAVGAIEDPAKKSSTAMQLLTDATTLNKLSSLDSSTAIDVLSGSLRQLQKPGEDMAQTFARGTDLLDAWVVVSRKANVDLATLATAFSITSESAENSGVSIEQLNAIIASLAEKIGGLGGRETGNAVRALIGGVYQQQAAEILTRYGIAVQDTTGRMRPFLDISREIYTLYKEGIISSDELNKIGYTLGGGVRRGQQYVAFLSDFERIQQLTNEQVDRGGASQEALGRKVQTTQTSITRLDNAFQSLAQTLGTTGGVLDSFNGLLSVATFLVDAFDKLTGLLGGLTIPATLLTAAGLFTRGEKGKLRTQEMATGMGSWFGGATTSALQMIPGMKKGYTVGEFPNEMYTTRAKEWGMKAGLAFGQYGSSILIGSMPAIFRAMQGDLTGAGISVGGAIAGAIISGGNPIGAIIGAAIADTFVEAVNRSKPEFQEFFEDITGNLPSPTGGRVYARPYGPTTQDLTLEERQQMLLERLLKENAPGVRKGWSGADIMMANNIQAWIKNLFSKRDVTGRQLAIQSLPESARQQILEAGRTNIPVEVNEELMQSSKIEAERLNLTKDYADTLKEIQETTREQLRQQAATGEIRPALYGERLETVSGLQESIPKLYTAFGATFDEINDSVNGTIETFQLFSDVLVGTSSENQIYISQLAQEIFYLTAGIEEMQKTGQPITWGTRTIEEAEATDILAQKIKEAADYMAVLRKEQQMAQIKIPSVVGLEGVTSMGGYTKVLDEARRLQQEYFTAGIEGGFLTPEQAGIMVSEAEPLFILLGDMLGYQLARGITDSRFITEAFDMLKEEVSKVNLGFQTFDVSNPMLAQVVGQANMMAEQWSNLYGYQPDYQEQIAITNEGVVQPMKADWKIVQYLLQQILDTEKKQLDGIYNLPEGASFYVPFQGYEMGFGGGGGGGGFTPQELIYKQAAYEDTVSKNVVSAISKSQDNLISKLLTPYGPPRLGKFDWSEGERFRGKTLSDFGDQLKSLIKPEPFEKIREIPIEPIKEIPKVETSLNLDISSNIQLMVDGRVLAAIVKQYLYEDLIRSEGVSGSINRTLVI